jgi:hypothetical protein
MRSVSTENVKEKTMGNVYRPVEQRSRLTIEYAEARMLFEERRQAQTRVTEIDRALRELNEIAPAAVQVAGCDMPFRRSPGRPRPGKKSMPVRASGVRPLLNTGQLGEP